MSRFISIYTPQILHHFHFISNSISTLFFVLFSFTRLLSLSWIFTTFPARKARLVNKTKTKEDHQLQFSLWCHFCFVSHSIPTLFLFGFPFNFDYRHRGVLRDFHKPLPLKRRFPTFHSRTSSFCFNPFFSLKPSKLLQSKFISTPLGKRSPTARLEIQLAIH